MATAVETLIDSPPIPTGTDLGVAQSSSPSSHSPPISAVVTAAADPIPGATAVQDELHSGFLPTSIIAGQDLTRASPMFSRDAKYVFCCCADVVRVFVKATGDALRDLRGHDAAVTSVCLHPKNRFQIFSSSVDNSIILWDFEDGLLLNRFAVDFSAVPKDDFGRFVSVGIHGLYLPEGATEGTTGSGNPIQSAYLLASRQARCVSNTKNNGNLHLLRGRLPESHDPVFAFHSIVLERSGIGDANSVDFGCDGRIAAAVDKNFKLSAYDAKSGECFRHRNSKKQEKMISLSCHPHLPLVVVGCHNGKILVINDVDRPLVTRVAYHWHSLPVAAVAFTRRGTHFLSGGHECVLVRWNLKAAGDRQYVPRLGAAVRRIAVSPNNDFYSASLSDNSVAVFGSTRTPEAVFGGMVRCPFKRAPDDVLCDDGVDDVPSAVRLSAVPTGLHLDPRSQCLVLNGRLGHLQFFDLAQDRCLQSLDILDLNFVSPDSLDGGQILAEVKLIAFDARGEWLVTVEQWKTVEISQQLRLKVWRGQDKASTGQGGAYSLHTVVNKPHSEEITQIAFRPYGEFFRDEPAIFATTSRDGKFKLWAFEEEKEEEEVEEEGEGAQKAGKEKKVKKEEKGSFWSNDLTASFHNQIPVDLDFSEDGSVVGVAFGKYLTLWTTETGELKDNHMNPDITDPTPLRQLLFGRGDSAHLVVYATRRCLVVYDVLTLGVSWFEDLSVVRLVRDPASSYMVAFEEVVRKEDDASLFVFKPSSKTLVDLVQLNGTADKGGESISAMFLPRKDAASSSLSTLPAWLRRSRFVYLNANQELIEIGGKLGEKDMEKAEEEEEEGTTGGDIVGGVRVKRLVQQTLFGALMMAEERKTDVVAPANVEFSASTVVGVPTRAFLDGPLSTPSHVLPHVSTLCKELQALILGGTKVGIGGGREEDETEKSSDTEGATRMAVDDESEGVVVSKQSGKPTERTDSFWDDALSRAPVTDMSWLKK